jgi:hypothetical protein
VAVDDAAFIDTSFPGFAALMRALGAAIRAAGEMQMGRAAPPRMIIAIDGPAAAGKGTLARRLAAALGLRLSSTPGCSTAPSGGAVLDAGGDPRDPRRRRRRPRPRPARPRPPDLRGPRPPGGLARWRPSRRAGRPARLPARFARPPGGGAVLDGRDIGTVVCPDARVKLFVTASLEARAGGASPSCRQPASGYIRPFCRICRTATRATASAAPPP